MHPESLDSRLCISQTLAPVLLLPSQPDHSITLNFFAVCHSTEECQLPVLRKLMTQITNKAMKATRSGSNDVRRFEVVKCSCLLVKLIHFRVQFLTIDCFTFYDLFTCGLTSLSVQRNFSKQIDPTICKLEGITKRLYIVILTLSHTQPNKAMTWLIVLCPRSARHITSNQLNFTIYCSVSAFPKPMFSG